MSTQVDYVRGNSSIVLTQEQLVLVADLHQDDFQFV
ncbi:hypothetical protein IWQ52_005270 [Labrenzia sp. EL_159]|nr:hypothetical protein [Labrenzia sp. EL_162]MBG6197720.1 hypothetical protein [Labrenzia sp. EL_159]